MKNIWKKMHFKNFYKFPGVLAFVFLLALILPLFNFQNNAAFGAGLQNLHEEIQNTVIDSKNEGAASINAAAASLKPEKKKYVMALLSDVHVSDDTYDAKEKVVKMLNGWSDIDAVAVLGDLCFEVGSEKEYSLAQKLFQNLGGTKYFITGNHDYYYQDHKNKDGKKVKGTEATRTLKLNRFKKIFNQKNLYFSKKVENYLFVFLSVDALEAKYITTLSETQLKWLSETLSKNKDIPTVIFCHSPLYGTFSAVHDNMNMNHSVIQPADKMKDIIKDNPQVFMWVSGHMHIKATSKDYDAPVNIYEKQVTCIHNSNMATSKNWINTLTLNDDYILVKTYDCKNKKWMSGLERKVKVPAKFRTKKDESDGKNKSDESKKDDNDSVKPSEKPDNEISDDSGEVKIDSDAVSDDSESKNQDSNELKIEIKKLQDAIKDILKQISDFFRSIKW